MSQGDLQGMRALLSKATPGPWSFAMTGSEGGSLFPVALRGHIGRIANRTFDEDQANGALIVAAVNALPALLDEIEQLRSLGRDAVGELGAAELREALADMVNQFGYWTEGENPGLTAGGLSALEGAFAALGYDDPHPADHLRCDEPGCSKQSGMGTPTMTGYRSTCFEHRPTGLTVGQRREQAEWMQANPTRTFNDWVAALNRRQDDPVKADEK